MPTPRRVQGFAIFLLTAAVAWAQPTTNQLLAARAQQVFELAQQASARHPNEATNAWQLGRASYDLALFATNSEQRAAIAQAGIAACRALVARDPKSGPGHYYLGMVYGELAEAEAPSMAAYHLIRDIEHEFKLAAELDERLDFAGPARCLGLLYRDAPGWPISIGSKHKAHEYLERAAALAPDFPENQLNLVESFVHWRQAEDAEKAWAKLAAIWPAAQTNLTGAAWEFTWADWNYRRALVPVDFQKAFRKPLVPPPQP